MSTEPPDNREAARGLGTRRRAQAILVAWPIAMAGWLLGTGAAGWTQHIGQAVFLGGLIAVIALGGLVKRSRVLATEAGWSAGALGAILVATMALFVAGLGEMLDRLIR